MIQERVRAGLARAKSEGKRLGRPRIAPELEERIRKALATPGRPGVRKIAERFGVDPGTVQRISRPRPFADGERKEAEILRRDMDYFLAEWDKVAEARTKQRQIGAWIEANEIN